MYNISEVDMTKEIINKDDLAMDSLIIYSKEEGILFNKSDDKKINVRSIAKLVTSLAFGEIGRASCRERV